MLDLDQILLLGAFELEILDLIEVLINLEEIRLIVKFCIQYIGEKDVVDVTEEDGDNPRLPYLLDGVNPVPLPDQ
jgi:hypothetical protein